MVNKKANQSVCLEVLLWNVASLKITLLWILRMTAQLNNPYTCLSTNTFRMLIVFLQYWTAFYHQQLNKKQQENQHIQSFDSNSSSYLLNW